MGRPFWLLMFLQVCSSSHWFFKEYSPFQTFQGDEVDPGEPLFLTPYVENGNITEGRRLARVPLTDDLGIESYAGFFTVNKTYNSNQYFWYFPPTVADTKSAPVVLWLQGGPGGSSLYGLFMENGPIQVNNGKITQRKYHWALKHHLIYIDNPVGAGFSFTENDDGYCTDQIRVGVELYSSVVQFLQLFPELQQNMFFVTGESYAGKYVPALAYTIHQNNAHAKIRVNLKGLAIGNGLSDPVHQMDYSEYLYQIGLIDWNGKKQLNEYNEEAVKNIHEQKWSDATSIFEYTFSFIKNVSGFEKPYNFLHTGAYFDDTIYQEMLQKNSVRKQIHVGHLSYTFLNNTVYFQMWDDMMKSVAPWISELLDYYKVLVYNGQLDIIVAYPLTRNYLLNLNFTGADEYKIAERLIWTVDGEVAGYMKKAGRLVEVMVRNAGHMVPTDQPQWAEDMLSRFTHDQL